MARNVANARHPQRPRLLKEFPRQGRLQLFLCEAKQTFTCTACLKDRKAKLVAIADGNWTRMICNDCYTDGKTPLKQEQNKKRQPQTRRKKSKSDPLARHARSVAVFFRKAEVPITYVNGWVVVDGERAFKATG